ncbi:MAG: hypothetical protein V3R68_07210, partial [Gammaproteobacteria bacterium]
MFAYLIYFLSILIGIPLFDWIHKKLDNITLQFFWDHIGMPLLRTVLILIFIFLAYPLIFGISDAPSLSALLAADDMRIHYIINAVFVVTLFFPLI